MRGGVVPVVAKDLVQVGDQVLQAVGREQFQRAAVDLQDAQRCAALAQAGPVLGQVRADIGHPLRAPAVEQLLEVAEVLQPQRHGRQLEHVLVIGPRG
ncbi:hypothetical protein D3C87_1853930 [compost metagenome]